MKEIKKIVIIGPAYPLRGGLATFDERLARECSLNNFETIIYTFSLQYPSFLFPGTTQYSEEPKPTDLDIHVAINSINPLSWISVGLKLKKLKPDIIIVRYWLPFMAPCLGSILRIAKRNKHTKVVCIADNIIPHEKRILDDTFTNYFIPSVDSFLTMSEKVLDDVKKLSAKKAEYIPHPVYDTFGEAVSKKEACDYLKLDPNFNYFLFFGFIRKYKGLDLMIEAINILKKQNSTCLQNTRFIVAGEYYEDSKPYLDLIEKYQLQEFIILHTNFINDSEVKYYFSVCDLVIQPYKSATQSGITPLAFYYEKPTLVTNVGGLAKFVNHQKTGIVCEPDAESISKSLDDFCHSTQNFAPNIKEEKKKYSWNAILETILRLGQ